MPRKRLTFIVIPSNDGQVREYRLPRGVLWAVVLLAVTLVGTLGYYAQGYHVRADQSANLERLRAENQDLMRGLELARKEVDQLEETMVVLEADDERLRDYHMMESISGEERLGGIGGSEELPEDYTALPAHKRTLLNDVRMRIFRLQQGAKVQATSFEEIRQKYLESKGDLKHFPTISPVPRNKAWISSGFGYRTDPFTGRRAFHSGIDFAGRTGTPVVVTADGIITHAYEDRRLGNVIVVEHDIEEMNEDGQPYIRKGLYQTEYGHLDKILVKKGQRVTRGQQIGAMGNTGRSTGPHLHYSVRYQDRRNGQYKGYDNPKKFLLDEIPRDERLVNNWWPGEE